MTDWKSLIEQTYSSEDGEHLTFGDPVEKAQLQSAETALGLRLPVDIREMLAAFDGAQQPTGEWIVFDAQTLMEVNEETRESYEGWDLPHPIENVLLFSDIYGTGDLCGICMRKFGSFRAGQVVLFQHESGEFTDDFEESAPNLKAYFVQCKAE